MHVNNFFVCGPKFTVFFSSNVGGVVVDQLLRFFLPSQILGGRASKNYTQVISSGSRHVVRKKDCEDTPTRPEVIDAQTLNFRPNF